MVTADAGKKEGPRSWEATWRVLDDTQREDRKDMGREARRHQGRQAWDAQGPSWIDGGCGSREQSQVVL